jgi:hypothetical protein
MTTAGEIYLFEHIYDYVRRRYITLPLFTKLISAKELLVRAQRNPLQAAIEAVYLLER